VPKSPPRYPDAFRAEAVELVRAGERRLPQIARGLGINAEFHALPRILGLVGRDRQEYLWQAVGQRGTDCPEAAVGKDEIAGRQERRLRQMAFESDVARLRAELSHSTIPNSAMYNAAT
jgi:hypothetical protein